MSNLNVQDSIELVSEDRRSAILQERRKNLSKCKQGFREKKLIKVQKWFLKNLSKCKHDLEKLVKVQSGFGKTCQSANKVLEKLVKLQKWFWINLSKYKIDFGKLIKVQTRS